MNGLDVAVMGTYVAVVLGVGAYFGRQQRDAADYFLGAHRLPWWAIMLSIVATETSALTVISIPGIAARGDLTFLQLPIGYIFGRFAVAAWLLPGYFTGEQETAYARLESRFGPGTRRAASAVFMTVRALGDSVRVFATAIPLSIVTGWSIPTSVLVLAAVTVVYTWTGGLKAVVWVDVIQLGIYVVAGIATIAVAAGIASGLDAVLDRAWDAGKLRVVDLTFSFTTPYTLLGGVIGGALLSAASHGTDHLIVQRLLATRELAGARRALIGSGILVLVQFGIFLLVGTFLWAAAVDAPGLASDEIYPRFIVEHLPRGLSGLVIAGILAAAMSTVSSSLNSLASASTHDFYSSFTGRRDARHLLWVGRWFTVLWAVVLVGGALAFRTSGQPVVELALSVASITYGALLGTYVLGGTSESVGEPDAIAALSLASAVMAVIVLGKPAPFDTLAWPWYVPLGTLITIAAGHGSVLVRRAVRRA